MNAKDIRKYTLLNQIMNTQPQRAEIVEYFNELAQTDFTVAFEAWEYTLGVYQKELADISTATNIESKVFDAFVSISETKTRQLLSDSAPLIKLIYGFSATVCSGANLTMLTNLILSNKLETVEVMLSAVRSNATGDFGEFMRVILDNVFKTYCERNDVKKCELSRKQSALLLGFIDKIKGPNKMLLTQRIKEL